MASVDVVVMAAGKGTRMKSGLPKVLHRLGGRALLAHVVDAAAGLFALALVVILWRHYVVEVLYPGEKALSRLRGPRQITYARYGYTYAHLAMVWGVVLAAVAIKTAMVDLTSPIGDLLEAGLAVGVLVFLAATTVFSRLTGEPLRARVLIPLALLAVLAVVGPQFPTALLLVAVTVVAALGINPRALGLRGPAESQATAS